jgi:predicted DNA-binding protein (MmcQ/YjbR family)
MHIEAFRNFCLAKKGTTESFPFDSKTLVFKAGGKIYALCNVHLFESANLKCDPEYALELRETYNAVKPGYHMNKKHWNTVSANKDLPDTLFYKLIDHSYDLIVKSPPKSQRALLAQDHN